LDLFEVKNLHFKYNDQWVLNDISFQGEEGELIAIVGPSGCGKTTLLKTLVGILTPQKGSILINQTDITQKSIEEREIGYVPQNQGLFPHLTVYANIAVGLVAQKWKKEHIEKRVRELAKSGEMEEFLKRRPHELSGGQQQRVALLRALAPSPKLLLLDEPLSNIDAHLREQLAIYIRNIQRLASITTLFVTHDLNEAKMLADKLIILNKGKILQMGSPMDVSLNPDSVEAAMTLGLKNLYTPYCITDDETKNNVILLTEIGEISIPKNLVAITSETVTGVYIDPSQIEVTKEEVTGSESLVGEILAVIPEPMIHQSTLLIKMHQKKFVFNEKKIPDISSKNRILRAQIPISDTDFNILDEVRVKIRPEALKFYR
jgi:ABC-type sugar transport system ATPase subunit